MFKRKKDMFSIKHLLHIDSNINLVYKGISTIEGLQGWWTSNASGSTVINEVIHFHFSPNKFFKMKAI